MPESFELGFAGSASASTSSPFSFYSPIVFGSLSGGAVGQTGTAESTATASASGKGGVEPTGSALGGIKPAATGGYYSQPVSGGLSKHVIIGGGIAAALLLYYVIFKM